MDEDKISRLKAIADLRDSGILSEAEFQDQKTKIMKESVTPNYTQQSYGADQQYTGQGDAPVDDSVKILFYILSFLIPIAGIIIGIIYHSKLEPWHKEFGKKCLQLALFAIIFGFVMSMLFFGAMFASL